MKRKSIIVLVFLVLSVCACQNETNKLVPADEKLLLKPAKQLTVEEMNKMRIVIDTNFGSFTIGLYPEKSPRLCQNFISLVEQDFYSKLWFHMVIPRYMVIAGDPKGDGTGGPGYWVRPQYNELPHKRGSVGMSHPPLAPEQIGSQFYILLTNSMRETNAYPVFGYVENGMEVLDRIGEVPTNGALGKPRPWTPELFVQIKSTKILVKSP
jgi:peptidyl-prolyl cis-trans isomerase B (cyclophilin B)